MDSASLTEANSASSDFRQLFDQSLVPMALVSIRDEPRFVAASKGFLHILEMRRAAVVDHLLDEVLARDDSSELAKAARRCLSTSQPLRVEVEQRAGANRRLVRLRVQRAGAKGFAGHALVEAVSESRTIGSDLESELSGQRFGHGESARFIHDLKRKRIRYADGGLARRLGVHGGWLHFGDFANRLHPDDFAQQSVFPASRSIAAAEEFAAQALRLRDVEGEWRLIRFWTRVLRRDERGAPRLMLGEAADVTEYAAAAAEAAGFSVMRSEENERARIGRELHDSTSQYLVAADLGLARILQLSELTSEGRARVLDVQTSLRAAQTEIRAFAYFLHPPELRELGLENTLERFCAGFARRSGLEIGFRSRNVPSELPSDIEHALFRVCQEALMNVHRHASARHVSVELHGADEHLVLEVRDDGVGVERPDQSEQSGTGLAGMKARMLAVGGDLSLHDRAPGLAVLARVLMRRSTWPLEADTSAGVEPGSSSYLDGQPMARPGF